MALGGLGKLASAALIAAALVGCGNKQTQAPALSQGVGAAALSAVGRITGLRGRATATRAAPLTRQALEQSGTPILRAAIPARRVDVLMKPLDVKRNIVTWSTSGVTLTLRDGVLIQTRGLGPDLMSAGAPTVAQLLIDGGTHQRVYYYLGDNDQPTRRTYECSVDVAGTEMIEIMQRRHNVTRVSETCVRSQESITNLFWIEGGKVRQSRQLLSAVAGFVELQQIID